MSPLTMPTAMPFTPFLRLARRAALAGALLAPTAWATPFTAHSDGTVTDSATGLMWDRCPLGLSGAGCTGTATLHTWASALTAAKSANESRYKGYTDWRLPNVNELESLVDLSRTGPAIDATAFPGTTSQLFWSSTTYQPYAAYAWIVYFGNGATDVDEKAISNYVRLVRSGQSFASFDVLDSLAPALTGPTVTPGTTGTTASASVTVSENATGYWQVLPAATAAPNEGTLAALGTSQQVTLVANAAGSISVTGLTAGTDYKLYFTAKDGAGNVQPTVASASFSTPNVPDIPTGITATPGTAGSGEVTVKWTEPSDNGSAITGYTVTPAGTGSGSVLASACSASLCTIAIPGLTNAVQHTFTVKATNGVGEGSGGTSAAVWLQGTQAITFANPGPQTFGTTLSLTASASSSASVTFTTTGVCSVAGNVLSFASMGTCTVQANQAGTDAYAAASPVPYTFAVNAAVVPEPWQPPEPTTGAIGVAPGGSARLTGPGSATLGTGATLTVEPGAAGSPIMPPATGSATVVLGNSGGGVTLGGPGQPVVRAPAPGGTSPVLGLGSGGGLTVGSSTPGQPLLDIGPVGPGSTASGQQVVAGPLGGRIQAEHDASGVLRVQVLSGSASLPCGLPCKGVPQPEPPAKMILQPGERARIDAQGVVQQVNLVVPTVPPPAGSGLTLPVNIPLLTGAPPARTPGETLLQQAQAALQTVLDLPATSVVSQGQQPAGQATWQLDGGSTLGLLPLDLPWVDLTVPDGASFSPNGLLRIARNGVVQEFGPAPLGLDAALQALRTLTPTVQLHVTDAGVWRIDGLGGPAAAPLVVRPSWLGLMGKPEPEPEPEIDVDAAGQVWVQNGGVRVPVYAAVADPDELRVMLKDVDAKARLQVLHDGSAKAVLDEKHYVLHPSPQWAKAPPELAGKTLWVDVEQERPVLFVRQSGPKADWLQALEVLQALEER